MAQTLDAQTSARRRVLVVDDALTIRMYYREVLEAAGFEVDEAANGIEGLEKAAAAVPDLIVVDINMPKMDGYAMLRTMRAGGPTQGIPAIMISTEKERRDADQAYEAGANAYLVKPVRPEMLRAYARLIVGVAAS